MTNINTDRNAMADAFAKAGIDTTTGDDTGDDREPGHAASPTAAACDAARLYGATPDPDEPDNRPVWDKDGAIAGTEQAFHVLAQDIAPDGYQLADERECLLWGFVNTFHAQVQRLDRAIDGIAPEMRELGRAQDGTEVKAWQLERLTERAHNLGDRRDAFEKLRDFAAEAYTAETGKQWRPRHGSHTSHTGRLTSAAIDARDFIRARKDRETRAHLPDGTLVAVADRARRLHRRRDRPSRPHRPAPLADPGPQSPFSASCDTLTAWKPFHPHTLRTYGALITERALVMPFPAQTATNAARVLPGKVYAFSIHRV